MVRSSNSTAAKLQKLSKADLIWCIVEYEKHSPGCPSVDAITADLKYKKDRENIDRCEKLAKQSHEKRLACNDLIAPYVGKSITEVPKPVFDRAVELLREAEAADEEWYRRSGIKVK